MTAGYGAQPLWPVVLHSPPSHVLPAARHRIDPVIEILAGAGGGGPGGGGGGAAHQQLTPSHCRRDGVTHAKPLMASAIGTRNLCEMWLEAGRSA